MNTPIMLSVIVVKAERVDVKVPFRMLLPIECIGPVAEHDDGTIFIMDLTSDNDYGWHCLGTLEDLVVALKKVDVVCTPLPKLMEPTNRSGPNVVPLRKE